MQAQRCGCLIRSPPHRQPVSVLGLRHNSARTLGLALHRCCHSTEGPGPPRGTIKEMRWLRAISCPGVSVWFTHATEEGYSSISKRQLMTLGQVLHSPFQDSTKRENTAERLKWTVCSSKNVLLGEAAQGESKDPSTIGHP
ncbi:hypothetical protein NDU88_009643 [Pleurodeles waltl]|uniref:Uncharacterized protein n=1 Tax=Pleurodeles waltl TaxID=8319 RepID=A0AAV7QU68_PLEWA|nr:hypothetical protein NDU88_009643 [Pleurodeles waltl]